MVDREMSFEKFKKIADQLPMVKEMYLTGLGEPMLHKDLYRMIEYLKKRKIRTVITTNATILNERNIENILRSGLDKIHVSIDSPDPETFKQIRVGTTLDKVTSNLKSLIERRNKEGSKLHVVINSIIMMRNYHQLLDMIKLAADVGADEISFSDMQYMINVGISTRAESIRCAPDQKKEEVRDLFKKAQALADDLGIQVGFPRLEQPKVRTRCTQPWDMLVTDETGLVRPCCAIHFVSFGDLTKQSLSEVWNNENFKTFREKLLSDNVSDKCKDCEFL